MAPQSRIPTISNSNTTLNNSGHAINSNNTIPPSLTNNRLLLYCGVLLLAGVYMGAFMVSSFLSHDDHSVVFGNEPNHLHPQETYVRKSRPLTQEAVAWLKGPNGPKYTVLVTGAAGFVGMHTALALRALGMTPIGYDNVNEYYSINLKHSRINELEKRGIPFVKGDVCDVEKLKETISQYKITRFIHLAAQAGVRYSLDHPLEYTRNNVDCTVNILEVMVELGLKDDPLVYASSSSVYGNNVKIPFQETDRVEDPASLYAATKRSDELIAHTYFNLHNISSIGLRFFTVYGPYGRYVSYSFVLSPPPFCGPRNPYASLMNVACLAQLRLDHDSTPAPTWPRGSSRTRSPTGNASGSSTTGSRNVTSPTLTT
jgi:dTDP-4-dehydrorhamnose reductase